LEKSRKYRTFAVKFNKINIEFLQFF